ncbi:hypothetical protein [Methylobacterium oryzae]|uniref:hypothetical protein n=1 Tax=Methylobacterium oryzae TaxID=334852 RepID=UPI0005C13A35|nr:hypothetical protein [Methylobacterium oryzae]
MAAEAAERDAIAAAEAAEARLRLRVSCPCCDGSPDGVLVSRAEKILRAWASPFLSTRPDDWNLGHLNAVAVGADTGAVLIPEGLFYPRPIAGAVRAEAVDQVPAGRTAAVTPKAEPAIPTKPRRKPTAAEIFAAGGDEGALDLTD